MEINNILVRFAQRYLDSKEGIDCLSFSKTYGEKGSEILEDYAECLARDWNKVIKKTIKDRKTEKDSCYKVTPIMEADIFAGVEKLTTESLIYVAKCHIAGFSSLLREDIREFFDEAFALEKEHYEGTK